MFAFSSACFFGEIMIILGNIFIIIYLIALIFFIKSISIIIAIFLVRRILNYFPSFLPFRVQSVLSIGCFIGYINPSSFLNITGKIFLIRFSSDRITSLTLNFFYLKFSIIFIFLRLAFTNSIFIENFFYISIITRAFLLITFYIIFRNVFWLSYQIFASYNIIEYTAVIQILRVSPGASPYFPMIFYILTVTFFTFSIF